MKHLITTIAIAALLFGLIPLSGKAQTGSIKGTVFYDLNGNGTMDGGDVRYAACQVRIAGPVNAIVYTSYPGGDDYVFTNLPSGNYTITAGEDSLGVIQTFPAAHRYDITLGDGENSTGNDFGFFDPGTVHGFVFEDLNSNGHRDPLEPGLDGWTMRLSGAHNLWPDQYSVTVIVQETNTNYRSINSYGIHPFATDSVDAVVGEESIWSAPVPNRFDVRFLDPTDHNRYGAGIWDVDYRPTHASSQTDTFKIGIQASSASDNITISWSRTIGDVLQSCRLVDDLQSPTLDVDMLTSTSAIITHPSTSVIDPLDPGTKWVFIVAERNPNWSGTRGFTVSGEGGGGGQYRFKHLLPGAFTTEILLDSGWTAVTSSDFTFDDISGTNDVTHDFPVSRVVPPSPVDTSSVVTYRTATYRDWADAKDQKAKRKAIKCKPDKVDFAFTLLVPTVPPPGTALSLKFSGTIAPVTIWSDTFKTVALFSSGGENKQLGPVSGAVSGTTILVEGRSLQGKPVKFSYSWDYPKNRIKGTVTSYKTNAPRLPMPNLVNVGEGIYGGIMQTPVNITVGTTSDPRGAHTVYHTKYKDILKSLVKEHRGGDIYHTASPHCLGTFDKSPHREINKQQKSLPPDKHNNSLFAQQLTLKLNVAASDSGIFPQGLGDLIYDNSGIKGLPGPLDGKSIRAIIDSVDRYLGCNGTVAGTDDATEFMKVDSLINAAFDGPMDTVIWSCGKVICTGVRPISEVPYLHASPIAIPRLDPHRGPVAMNYPPSKFALSQNYPNPFNPTTTIEFELAQDALVTVRIYNTLGQEVATLIHSELMDVGEQDVEFDAGNLPSGVYYYHITAADAESHNIVYSAVRKMMLVK